MRSASKLLRKTLRYAQIQLGSHGQVFEEGCKLCSRAQVKLCTLSPIGVTMTSLRFLVSVLHILSCLCVALFGDEPPEGEEVQVGACPTGLHRARSC